LAWLSLSTNTDFFTAEESTPDKPASPLLQELDCALGLGKGRAKQFENMRQILTLNSSRDITQIKINTSYSFKQSIGSPAPIMLE
jgi:hypothetical protein